MIRMAEKRVVKNIFESKPESGRKKEKILNKTEERWTKMIYESREVPVFWNVMS
jgi:hypothetical protein